MSEGYADCRIQVSLLMNIALEGQFLWQKGDFSLDTPLKPWTWISASLIGCKAPTDNTCLTPSSKLTPGALRNIGSITCSSCIQSNSCPISHRAAAPSIQGAPSPTQRHSHSPDLCSGDRSSLSEKQCLSNWPCCCCWFCQYWSK